MNPEVMRLFDDIENAQFAARQGVASDLRTFLLGIMNEPSVQGLRSLLESADVRETVLQRCANLSRVSSDPRYENPNDTALAAYLALLDLKCPELARLGAHYVSTVSRCWWANKLACHLLFEGPVENAEASESSEDVLSHLFPRMKSSVPQSYNVSIPDIGEPHVLRWESFQVRSSETSFKQTTLRVAVGIHALEGKLGTRNQSQEISANLWRDSPKSQAA